MEAVANGNGNGNHEPSPVPASAGKRGRPVLPPHLLDPGGVAGTSAVLPGHNGLPFRGSLAFLKDEDPEVRQPQMGLETHCHILNLGDPEDMEYYTRIWQLASNQFVLISKEDMQYDAQDKTWRVLLRWAFQYAYIAK
jgi:hypothetical protein